MSGQSQRWHVAGERGYSLLEIMVVITMVGVIAAMAIGSYRTAVPQSRLREATTELHSTFGLARILAMSNNASVTVKLSGASQSGSPNFTITGSYATPILVTLTRTVAGAESTIQSNRLTGEISSLTIDGLNFPTSGIQPWVRFNSMGLRFGTGNQIITLTNTQGRVTSINVSPGGKAKYCIAATCP